VIGSAEVARGDETRKERIVGTEDVTARVESWFDPLERWLAAVKQQAGGLMTLVDDTATEMGKLKTIVANAITALQAGSTALRTTIADQAGLIKQLEASGALPPAQMAVLQGVHDDLVATEAEITTAVTNLTPPAPAA
jgi:hypothetical protein